MKEYAVWFTSREQQALAFVDSFRRETQALSQTVGSRGVNRAWLVQRFRHECSILNVPYAYFDFGDGRPWDYLGIMRQTRDQMGAAYFNLLTRALNKIGTGFLPSLAEVDHLDRRDIRAARGHSAVEKDDYAVVRAKKKKTQQTLEGRVTLAFHTCLKALSAKGPLVLTFDSYDKVTATAHHWICASLFPWTCEGQVPRLIILAAGQEQPSFGSAWQRHLAPITTLASLTEYVCMSESCQQLATQERGRARTKPKGTSP